LLIEGYKRGEVYVFSLDSPERPSSKLYWVFWRCAL